MSLSPDQDAPPSPGPGRVGRDARASTAPAPARWDPAAILDRARRTAEDGASRDGSRVLKRGPRSIVVWLEAAGPEGEPVVVKSTPVDGPGDRLGAWLGGSASEVQRRGAELLLGAGIPTAAPLAAVDRREAGGERTSNFIARAVVDHGPLREAFARQDARGRRRLARSLGRFIARLHRSGVYVPDLKEQNLLAAARDRDFAFVLVDLDRVRRPRGGVSLRRRVANLVQLDRTLGWLATERERVALLEAYRKAAPLPSRAPLAAALESAAARLAGRPGHRRSRSGRSLASLAAQLDRARRLKDRNVASRRRRAGVLPAERTTISCLVVTGNEIGRIRECLESVAWCDEIIVVDSHSTDGTFDVCREYTPLVERREWRGYRAQKSYALTRARHPWVLNVDADERVSPELRAEIAEILANDGRGYDAFTMPRLVRYMGRWWRYGGWYPDRRLRLFRRERAVWGGTEPHERVMVRGYTGRLAGPLLHYTYDDVADHVETVNRFTTIAARPRDAAHGVSAADLWLRPLWHFVRFYALKGAWRMGFPGLFVSITDAFYAHLKYAKRDEADRAPREAP